MCPRAAPKFSLDSPDTHMLIVFAGNLLPRRVSRQPQDGKISAARGMCSGNRTPNLSNGIFGHVFRIIRVLILMAQETEPALLPGRR
jgi:hypothetical protein